MKNNIVEHNRQLYPPILAQVTALKLTIEMAPKTLQEALLLASVEELLNLEPSQELKEILVAVNRIYKKED